MTCIFKYQELCRIYRIYVSTGLYKGEFCQGCLWWTTTEGEIEHVTVSQRVKDTINKFLKESEFNHG